MRGVRIVKVVRFVVPGSGSKLRVGNMYASGSVWQRTASSGAAVCAPTRAEFIILIGVFGTFLLRRA